MPNHETRPADGVHHEQVRERASRDDIALAPPAWDLLPPTELLRRHVTGPSR